MRLIEPFSTTLDKETGLLKPGANTIQRHLSDMQRMYADSAAVRQILTAEGDRLIYEVCLVDTLPEEGRRRARSRSRTRQLPGASRMSAQSTNSTGLVNSSSWWARVRASASPRS